MDEQSIISALYADISRNPNTTDPKGQSGLNRVFRQIAREETAGDLAPIKAELDTLSAKVDALAQQQAQPVSQDALTAAVNAGFGTILADLLQVIQKGQTA